MNATQVSAQQRDSTPTVSWAEANQACLVMEFARLRQKLDATAPQPAHRSGEASLDIWQPQHHELLDPHQPSTR